jgi:hypothetical protein
MKKLTFPLILSIALMLTFTTCKKEEAISPILISTLDVTQITTTSAMSGGMITDDGGKQIVSRGVVWSLTTNPSTENNLGIRFEGTGAGTFNSLIANLSENTNYYVRAFATNSNGTTYGNEMQFTTKEGQIPSVSIVEISNITHNEATFSAEITNNGGSAMISRGFCWSEQPNPTTANNQINIAGDIGEYSKTISGLVPNSTYYVRSFAINASGTAYGEEVSFTTSFEPVADGYYLVGDGTALVNFDLKGQMKPTLNELGQEPRAELLELFVSVKAGSEGFNIVKVAGTTHITYGPSADFAEVTELHLDEPRTGKFWRGSLAETSSKFTVPEDGLYHVVYDTELGIAVVAHVKWGVIGSATPGGWGESTPMTATFDLNKMDFTVTEITMLENSWKLRYSNGWKIFIDAAGTVRVNTNLGGSITAPVPGAADIFHDNYGIYTITLTWELGEGWVGSMERTGDGDPIPEYPEAMYLVGAASAYGWATPGENDEAIMHKLAGGESSEGIFWKIAHLDGGAGFKMSAAGWSDPNIGFNEVDVFDPEGVVVSEDGGNFIIAESGMYMIVLNLRNNMTKVSIKEAAVYGIGDAFGGWDAGVLANKFTVNHTAKTLISPALPASGNIRIYADHSWISDWWNAEFNVFDGIIEYRNDGSDLGVVPGSAGQVISLSFDDNTGSIK